MTSAQKLGHDNYEFGSVPGIVEEIELPGAAVKV